VCSSDLTLAVTVSVVTSAQTGHLNFLGSSSGLNGATTVVFSGNKGTVQLSFASSTSSAKIVTSINQFTDSTGIQAILSSDNKSVQLLSTDYGTSQFVSVNSSNSTALSTKDVNNVSASSDYGRNATLTVNGTAAFPTA